MSRDGRRHPRRRTTVMNFLGFVETRTKKKGGKRTKIKER
ncbi:unnamed protein product [Linum tenue]|uniref:Uncharacterized protein n=1 Tax=Linum tenue TaxID=586396 RepID=A0AAV0H3K0_9ROSI|nr:unnamed protein product [Linum tenue]